MGPFQKSKVKVTQSEAHASGPKKPSSMERISHDVTMATGGGKKKAFSTSTQWRLSGKFIFEPDL